jgi:hypothetical protein
VAYFPESRQQKLDRTAILDGVLAGLGEWFTDEHGLEETTSLSVSVLVPFCFLQVFLKPRDLFPKLTSRKRICSVRTPRIRTKPSAVHARRFWVSCIKLHARRWTTGTPGWSAIITLNLCSACPASIPAFWDATGPTGFQHSNSVLTSVVRTQILQMTPADQDASTTNEQAPSIHGTKARGLRVAGSCSQANMTTHLWNERFHWWGRCSPAFFLMSEAENCSLMSSAVSVVSWAFAIWRWCSRGANASGSGFRHLHHRFFEREFLPWLILLLERSSIPRS